MEKDDKKVIEQNETVNNSEIEVVDKNNIANEVVLTDEADDDNTVIAAKENTNTHLRRLISGNYIEYASYVIKERAIPDVNDGMKPVQRRILWSMYRMDDGKFNKVANIVGHAMQYHPHGDASIYMALVHLANKEYFIEKQGNFGNIFTGDAPAAARYIEARLTPLAKEVLFNPDITDFVDSYDGRNKEPIFFPAKVPALLMTGQEGIAPGMTTNILPHNFKELLEAQIAVLKNETFELYPDFLQGGIMNVSDYEDGNGKILLRAKVDIDGRRLIIREIPAMTTTEKLIASIEKAVNKNKLKVASISDYTAENVEIEIIPARGYKPEKTLKLLYAYTDCSMSISSSLLVIKDNRPEIMTVSDVLKYNTECLVEYLRRELQIELDKLYEKYHEKTLERIFIENRIYKRIEECKTYELVLSEVRKGLSKFIDLLKREITDKDIEHLLAIPIRRISRFDMEKNRKDIDDILAAIDETEKNLKSIIKYSINYIKNLIKKFADNYPRRTEIEEFEKVDVKAAALNNIKVGWDRKNCYIGTSVKSDDVVTCNEFDHLHCIDKRGIYKIISIPQKIYIGRLYYFNKYNKDNVFSIVYKDRKTNIYYLKRCIVDKFIRDKEYNIIPKDCQLELITTRERTVYECTLEKKGRQKLDSLEIDFSTVQLRSPGARGFRFTDKKILKFRYKGQVEFEKSSDEGNDPDDTNTPEIQNDKINADSDSSSTVILDSKMSESITKNVDAEKDSAEHNNEKLSTKVKVESTTESLQVDSTKPKEVSEKEKIKLDKEEGRNGQSNKKSKLEEDAKPKASKRENNKPKEEVENTESEFISDKAVEKVDKDITVSDIEKNDQIIVEQDQLLTKVKSKTVSSDSKKRIDADSDKQKVNTEVKNDSSNISELEKTDNKFNTVSDNDDDDLDSDWGIIQPDLGF